MASVRVRSHSFGTLSTVDSKNKSHSIGLIYAISHQGRPMRIYATTQMKTRKVINIKTASAKNEYDYRINNPRYSHAIIWTTIRV